MCNSAQHAQRAAALADLLGLASGLVRDGDDAQTANEARLIDDILARGESAHDHAHMLLGAICGLAGGLSGALRRLDPDSTPAQIADMCVAPIWRLVIVESPFAGDVAANIDYARACVRDCVLRGEAPIASHLLFTQPGILKDDVPAERALGIDAGLAWLRVADASVVYVDRGISGGMAFGIARATERGLPVEYRSLVAGQVPG